MRNHQVDNDTLLLIVLGMITAMWGLSTIEAWAPKAGAWLVDKAVLVPAPEAVLALPHTDAGLDTARLIILGAALLLLLLIGAYTLRRALSRR